jgi:putative transposase
LKNNTYEIIREAEKKVRRYLRISEMKSCIDNAIKEICDKEGVAEQELRLGVRTRKYSRVRAKIAYHLSHEFGISRAEIARQLGVCTSAIAKAIQTMGGVGSKCYFSTTSPPRFNPPKFIDTLSLT